MKVNNIVPNCYHTHTKSKQLSQFNQSKQSLNFKGTYFSKEYDNSYLEDLNISPTCQMEMNEMFSEIFSPMVNVSINANNAGCFVPFRLPEEFHYSDINILLADIPIYKLKNPDFYKENRMEIEDLTLDLTFNHFLTFVEEYDFKPDTHKPSNEQKYKKLETLLIYLGNQKKYIEQHPEKFSDTYKAKFALFKNFSESREFQRVYNSLKEFAHI